MILYHGSNTNIERIDIAKSKPNKDFGKGFYLSADKLQAQQLAEQRAIFFGGEPVLNAYNFDESILKSGDLKILLFDSYSSEWAEFVLLNRNNPTKNPAHDYDIVYGPIANDKVGVQVELFIDNIIDMPTLIERLKYLHGITFQYYFGSEAAIAHLHKISV